LMYGYAARYAPSTVIEARINALVVCYLICRQTCFSFLCGFDQLDEQQFECICDKIVLMSTAKH
jgi:hypothetical protein